jgi:hypothetical protein
LRFLASRRRLKISKGGRCSNANREDCKGNGQKRFSHIGSPILGCIFALAAPCGRPIINLLPLTVMEHTVHRRFTIWLLVASVKLV